MKRSATSTSSIRPAKKSRPKLPDYHETAMKKDEGGEDIWPAPKDQIDNARDFILKW